MRSSSTLSQRRSHSTRPAAWICIAIITAAAALYLAAARADVSSVVTEVQNAFDAGDYRDVLKRSSKAMALREAPLPAQDRYALLMLRGEALLRLKERTYAVDAFEAASRAAGHDHFKVAAI